MSGRRGGAAQQPVIGRVIRRCINCHNGGVTLVTIVKHKKTGKKYVLIGTGFGMFKTVRASMWGGNLSPQLQSGEKTVVAVADREGAIKWIDSGSLRVLEIDGRSLEDIYSEIPLDVKR